MTIIPVILAGGSGTRLWPSSRLFYPKQLIPMVGEKSLLQDTVERLEVLPTEPPIVVCSDDYRFLVAQQLKELDQTAGAIVLEPAPKSTAPAVALAALLALEHEPDPLLLVLPSDHVIADREAFADAVQRAAAIALSGGLVTFGAPAKRPDTGFGYIRRGEACQDGSFRVAQFVEKPNKEDAAAMVASGDYLWNAGIFLFSARGYVDELRDHAPEIVSCCEEAVREGSSDMDFFRPSDAFLACPANSIDYAVFEKTERAHVVGLNACWSDIGSWHSLWEVSDKDDNGNAIVGDAVCLDTHNSLVRSEHRLVACVGVEDLAIVETRDAVLVADKERVEDVKALVQQLKEAGRPERTAHVKVFRPWGNYESVENGERYQMKRITVNPGASLSMQMHYHRAEHWIVVKGTALVHRGDEELLLGENESTYIPLGTRHRLTNPGKLPLELVEVQVGTYLGEDDIVRFDDDYGRA